MRNKNRFYKTLFLSFIWTFCTFVAFFFLFIISVGIQDFVAAFNDEKELVNFILSIVFGFSLQSYFWYDKLKTNKMKPITMLDVFVYIAVFLPTVAGTLQVYMN